MTTDSAADHRSGGEFMLFGVRVRVDPMRKSVSLNDLSQYHHFPHAGTGAGDGPSAAAGYASADDAVPQPNSGGTRERKRGVPWTEDEHKLFLLGLQKVGKGDWRGISRNFVKTRTPTQVASHAQKYFLRRSNLNRRRRRSSLFDITTDSVTPIPMEEIVHQEQKSRPVIPPTQLPLPESSIFKGPQGLHYPLSMCPTSGPLQINTPVENFNFGDVGHINHHGLVPNQTKMVDFNLNQSFSEDSSSPLSLNLSLSLDRVQDQFSRVSAFEVMSSFSNGDSMISVT